MIGAAEREREEGQQTNTSEIVLRTIVNYCVVNNGHEIFTKPDIHTNSCTQLLPPHITRYTLHIICYMLVIRGSDMFDA